VGLGSTATLIAALLLRGKPAWIHDRVGDVR